MNHLIVSLASTLPASLVGRKAAALGRLLEAGFPIPSGVCITTEAFHEASHSGARKLHLPKGLLEVIIEVMRMDEPLAVRSSAVEEDRPEASLAGRYASYLNVTGRQAIEEAILSCWHSYLSASSERGKGGIAILIQPILDAECAGVCFSVDPVKLRADLLLVAAGWGLGTGVVSGAVPTDTIRLRRMDLHMEVSSIAYKHTAIRPAKSGGVEPVYVAEELRNIPCLPENWLERVGQYGLAIEQVFGTPQDVEWAITDEKLWILQSRPITALPNETREAARFPIRWSDEEEPRHYWWLEGARESNNGPLLPSEVDFFRIRTVGGQDSVYFAGWPETRWRKYANGRVYMCRSKSLNSEGRVRVYNAALRDLYERLKQQDVTSWEHWGPEVVAATWRLGDFEASEADGKALAEHLEDAIATASRHWMVHTMGGERPIRSAALLNIYTRITGFGAEEGKAEIPFLLAGSETVQTRLVEALYDLAYLANKSPEAAKEYVLNHKRDEAPAPMNLEPFAAAFRSLMAEYGGRLCYRPAEGYPVDLPMPWREAPEHVWDMVAAYLPMVRAVSPSPRETRLETLRTAENRLEELEAEVTHNGIDPRLVEDFRRTLTFARRGAASLDEANHYIDQLSEGQYVQALLYAGQWLKGEGRLANRFDVFWLEAQEVLASLREPTHELEAIIAERRKQFSEWERLITPACLGLPETKLPERPAIPAEMVGSETNRKDLPNNHLTGEPTSRGQAAGRARLILNERLPADITPGDVLIAPNASLAMIPYLPATSALVLDYGGPGDHFAITAREFGLPAVCGTLYATQRIPEGAWVSVDATEGTVSWE